MRSVGSMVGVEFSGLVDRVVDDGAPEFEQERLEARKRAREAEVAFLLAAGVEPEVMAGLHTPPSTPRSRSRHDARHCVNGLDACATGGPE